MYSANRANNKDAITKEHSERNLYSKEKPYSVFRPVWTCGRYNAQAGVAIYYNLLSGMSYLFEDLSAKVVSYLLDTPRNGNISITEIAQKTNIDTESIYEFFSELMSLGLITSTLPTDEQIQEYRKRQCEYNREHQAVEKTTEEKLPMSITTTEMDYMEKAGGVFSVMFELTYNCSEKCVHCYNIGATRNDTEISHRGDFQELSLKDYQRIIDELYEQGLVKVCLTGGVPFSKPFVWELIDYIYSKGLVFVIYTNGQRLINDVQRLANYFPHQVGVSIYSEEAAIHDNITRVKGSWEKSIKVVEGLSRLAVPLVLKCCVMRPNVKNYYEVKDLAKKYGALAQFELNVTDSIDGDKCVSHYLRLTPEQLEIVLRDDNIPMYVGKEAPNYGGQKKDMKKSPCGAGENTFCITPDGMLIPCCAFHLPLGDLKRHSLSEILSASENLQYWKGLTLEEYEECGNHDYCDYCNLCPGNNYSEHGTPTKAAENNCFMAKCRHSLAIRMMNGYDPLHKKPLHECLSDLQVEENFAFKRVFVEDIENQY